ncbi:MAG TPA: alpha-ketoglutarate-dependent dioxygenase AlkB [Acidimicrobiia bacterium]
MVAHQRSLFAAGEPGIDDDARWERVPLDPRSWVDVARGWLRGADTLLDALEDGVAWESGRRWMYGRVVDDPRLHARASDPASLPHPGLVPVRNALEAHYRVPFGPVALNYYRDGRDSVAFHRDRQLRRVDDTLIAIVTLGARRPFDIRPRAGRSRPSRDFAPGSGDLLVMGGACQMAWEHAVPKVAHAGPRISVTWRWSGAKKKDR